MSDLRITLKAIEYTLNGKFYRIEYGRQDERILQPLSQLFDEIADAALLTTLDDEMIVTSVDYGSF